jgi:hypothetical protein
VTRLCVTRNKGEDILQSAEVDAQIRTEVASETTQQVGSKGRQSLGMAVPLDYLQSGIL